MAGWYHWLHGRESEWTLGVGDGQGGLACCDSWGHKESDTTERLNWTDTNQPTYLFNPYQNTHDIFNKTRRNNPNICIELQKPSSCQRNLYRKEENWRYHAFLHYTPICSNQNNIILAEKQMHGQWDCMVIQKRNPCTYGHSSFPGGTSGKEVACQGRRHKAHGFNSFFWKIPWRRSQQPTPVFLSGESPGQRSLVGYSS